MGPQLNFKHTTRDHTIYKTTYKGHNVVLLHQVNDTLAKNQSTNTIVRRGNNFLNVILGLTFWSVGPTFQVF